MTWLNLCVRADEKGIMGKNSGSHVIKDNTICDIRVHHSGEGTAGTRRLRGREMGLNACRSPKGEERGE